MNQSGDRREVGFFSFVLHSHLPYLLGHGRWPHGSEWLSEVLAECYLPLLRVLERAVEEGLSPQITLGITPVLAEQLQDPRCSDEFLVYLDYRTRATRADADWFQSQGEGTLAELAGWWHHFYTGTAEQYQQLGRDILGSFKMLQDRGYVEIITSAATHAYLPLLSLDSSVRAQVRQGIQTYRRLFQREPEGFWLPELAYRPRHHQWGVPWNPGGNLGHNYRKGLEEFLKEEGIRYFIVDAHMLSGRRSLGPYHSPYETADPTGGSDPSFFATGQDARELPPYRYYLASSGEAEEGVAVMARDPWTAVQVWSGKCGYPAHNSYLEFHKKSYPSGTRYWRITSQEAGLSASHSRPSAFSNWRTTSQAAGLSEKEIYDPEVARARAKLDAARFVKLVTDTLEGYREREGTPGILCAPFDTELFGHWWFEGPQWLYEVLKAFHSQCRVRLVTCSEYISEHGPGGTVCLPEGSWGEGGGHFVWLNGWTQWTWDRIHEAEREMQALADSLSDISEETLKAILNQAAREFLALSSSDWQFLISMGAARDYAEKRFHNHYSRFKRLAHLARSYASEDSLTEEDRGFLAWCQKTLSPFQDIRLEWFR